jgi:WD40 repeat protein
MDKTMIDVTKTAVVREQNFNSPLLSCRYDPGGRFIFAGTQDYRVRRWDLEQEGELVEFDVDAWVRGIAFADGGKTLITAGYDGRLIWWPAQAEKPEPMHVVQAHEGWARGVAVSPDGALVASVGNDRMVRLWDAGDARPVREMAGHESHVYNVLFHPDGTALATGDLLCHAMHWNVESGEQARTWRAESLAKYDTSFRADIGGFRGMAFTPDGKQLACSGITEVTNAFAGVGKPSVVVFDWESGEQVVEHLSKDVPRGCAWGVGFLPDGTVVAASGGTGGFLLFWKPGEAETQHEFKLPDTARDLALSPDGLSLATGHYDGRVRISRVTGKEE